jgi:hypothetical protein
MFGASLSGTLKREESSNVTVGVILGALVLALPGAWFLRRRDLHSLHRKVDQAESTVTGLRRQLRTALVDASQQRDEHVRLNSTVGEIRGEIQTLRNQLQAEKYRTDKNQAVDKIMRQLVDLTKSQSLCVHILGLTARDH